jgi:hypothetical protein
MNDLTNKFWDEHFRSKEFINMTKIKQKIYNWLNEDNFGGFVIDGKIFWIEKVCSTSSLPNYIYDYLIKWGEKAGYKYLYS